MRSLLSCTSWIGAALVLGACASRQPAPTNPGLTAWVPEETREHEHIATTPPSPPEEPPPEQVPPTHEVDTDCMFDPSDYPACGPALSPEIIRSVVKAHAPMLHACWQHASEGDEGDPGLSFTISSDGSVSEVRLREGLTPSLDACLRQELHAMQFPAPHNGGSVIVSYPWRADVRG